MLKRLIRPYIANFRDYMQAQILYYIQAQILPELAEIREERVKLNQALRQLEHFEAVTKAVEVALVTLALHQTDPL